MVKLLDFWASLPAGLRAYFVSLALTLQSTATAIATVGYALGLCSTPGDTLVYFQHSWWAGLLAVFFGIGPYYRAHKSNQEESNANQSPNP